MFTFVTCVIFMAFVAWYSWLKTRGQVSSASGYFLAGNGLGPLFIAGSLLLTNISTEQLIGQSGLTYFGNLTPMAWEVWAVRGIILLALLFLPMYLGGAFATVPQFLKSRYGETTRRMIIAVLMFGYIFVWSPAILYGGSLALMKILDIEATFGLSQSEALWIVTWIIGSIGAAYAIFGGLKAVAISDTINGIGLIVVGSLVPIFGLMALSDNLGGSMLDALNHIATTHTEKLNAIGLGDKGDAIPFSAVFTGLMVTATFYWATNQFVIQRALGSQSLEAGQKGLLFSGFFKLLVPFLAMFPGLIAFHIYGEGLSPRDIAYPTLVADTLPAPLLGVFVAVLLGAVFSTFNSLLNSSATVFALDVYKPFINKDASDEKLIKVSKIFATISAIFAMLFAPSLLDAPSGLFVFMHKFTGFIAVPVVTLVLMGLFSRKLRTPPRAAQFIIAFHMITYYVLVWGLKDLGMKVPFHWMHVFAILFVVEVCIIIIWSKVAPAQQPEDYIHKPAVEMKPWKYAMLTTFILLSFATLIYVVFSPIGLAYSEDIVGPTFQSWFFTVSLICLALTTWAHFKLQPKYEKFIINRYGRNEDKEQYKNAQRTEHKVLHKA